MKISKLKEMLEQDIRAILNTTIINTDIFQITIGSNNTTIYIENITDTIQEIEELLQLFNTYIGTFVCSGDLISINPDDVLILEFDDEFNIEKVIDVVRQYELLNSKEIIALT